VGIEFKNEVQFRLSSEFSSCPVTVDQPSSARTEYSECYFRCEMAWMWFGRKWKRRTAAIDIILNTLIGSETTLRHLLSRFKLLALI